ncbi:MAG: hypothetical protein ACLTC0_07200 [Eisenbergiella massiliensis]|uniref:hypothetical protein n=1 Tax=Eisenbergiella massiliensis TaxID=1720294 RepID=UPI0039958A50
MLGLQVIKTPSPACAFEDTGNSRLNIMKGRDFMNIFRTQADILGCRKEESPKASVDSFLFFARQLRSQLGKKGYLLDTYVSLFFETINETIALNAAEDGFAAAEQYRELCNSILHNSDAQNDSPLYGRIFKIFNEHPFITAYQETNTKKALLYSLAADVIMADSVTEYIKQQEYSIDKVMDIVQFRDIYGQISMIVGDEDAEELNCRLKQTFLVTQLLPIYRQAFRNDLLFKLTWRDPETSRQVFQLILDNLPG